MRRLHSIFLILTLAGIHAAALHAQTQGELYCTVIVEGQNRNRKLAGDLNVECGFQHEPHTAPFGNWGVSSNYSTELQDTDQFRGWKDEGGGPIKLHWNSCTSDHVPPNCAYYNASGCSSQKSDNVVIHGRYSYRYTGNQCPQFLDPDNPPPSGCSTANGEVVDESTNHMTLYELDGHFGMISLDGHDLVETLYFPSTSVTLRNCNYEGCPEQTTGWVDMDSSTSTSVHVEAELRMKASATLEGYCDLGYWDWE